MLKNILLKILHIIMFGVKSVVLGISILFSAYFVYSATNEYESVEIIIGESEMFLKTNRKFIDKILTSEIHASISEINREGYTFESGNREISISFSNESNINNTNIPMSYEEWKTLTGGLGAKWFDVFQFSKDRSMIMVKEFAGPGWGDMVIEGTVYATKNHDLQSEHRNKSAWNIMHWLWIESLGKNTSNKNAKRFVYNIEGAYFVVLTESAGLHSFR